MTLDYKILGQKYFGSAVDDTTSINTAVGAYGYYAPTAVNVTKRYSRFLAVLYDIGKMQLAYTDDNGISWKRHPDLPASSLRSLCFGNNNLVTSTMSNSGNRIIYSKNGGESWIDSTIVTGSMPTDAEIYFAKDIFLTTGLYSYDGIKWNSLTLPFSVSLAGQKAFIHDGKSYWFGPYSAETIYKSTDGFTWTAVALPNNLTAILNNQHKATYGVIGGIHYLLFFNDGHIHYSTDFGNTWTQRRFSTPSFSLDTPEHVHFVGDRFIAITRNHYLDSGLNPTSGTATSISWTSTSHQFDGNTGIGGGVLSGELVAYNYHDNTLMGLKMISSPSYPNRYRFASKTSTNLGLTWGSETDSQNGLIGFDIRGFIYINQFENGSDRFISNWSNHFDNGGTKMSYSDDYGVTWSTTTKPPGQHQIVAYGNGTFVAGTKTQAGYPGLSNNPFIISKDGITWRIVTMADSYGNRNNGQSFDKIIFMNDMFFALITEQIPYPENNRLTVATSQNGVVWSFSKKINIDGDFGQDAYKFIYNANPVIKSDMVYGNNKLVLIGSVTGNGIAVTDDLVNYTRLDPSQFVGSLAYMTYGNGIFLIVTVDADNYDSGYTNNASRVYISTNGSTWTQSTNLANLGFGSFKLNGCVYAFNNFIIFTRNPNMMLISPNGITWTKREITYPYNTNNYFIKATEDGSLIYFITTGSSNSGNDTPESGGPYYFGYMNSLDKINVNESFTFNSIYGIGGYGGANLGTVALAKNTGNKIIQVQASIGGQGATGTSEITSPQIAYTVPSGKEAVITSIFATNRDSYARLMDIAIVPSGETLSLKHHIRWNMLINPNDYKLINTKITMQSGSSLYIFPSTFDKIGSMVFGVELS